MLLNLEVWLAALVIILPAIVDGFSCAAAPRYYRSRQVPGTQKSTYLAGLIIASAGALVQVNYWAWRVSALYRLKVPLPALIVLDRCLYPSAVLSSVAIVCFFIGRGPYRLLLALAALLVALQIWIHGGVLHWA